MAFDVFPAAATPLHLAAAANSGLVAFTKRVSGEAIPTMYIRVAMSNIPGVVPATGMGHDPTVALQVDAGAEAPITMDGFTHAVNNGAGFEADASMVYESQGVYLIKVFFIAPSTPDKFT